MSTSLSDISVSKISGLYYDGRTSRAHDITFQISGGMCRMSGHEIDKAMPVSDIKVAERLDKAHRLLHFRDGSSCELPDSDRLSELLGKAGLSDSAVNQLQRSWPWVIAAVFVLSICLFSAYKWGLPYVAKQLAYKLPYYILTNVSQKTMETLDGRVLQPSKLPPERQEQLRERFLKVTFPGGQKLPIKILFRDSEQFGANAFALPDGTIVFFDKLVQLADNDDELVAVFAHEAGHVANRHALRQLIQSSIVAMALAAYFGDVSSLSGALSGFLLQAKYSRDFESDADRFAVETLKLNNVQPRLLGTFLLKLEDQHKKKTGAAGEDKMWDYISSHPSSKERMKEIDRLSAK